jgi:biopolymer transport protein TolR
MAFSTEDSGGPVANINVTPLVDVMLVLLIIFMVTTPMMQQGVEVNLPRATTAPLKGSSEQIVLSITSDGKLFLGKDNELELNTVAERIKGVMALRPPQEQKIYIQADAGLEYGTIMEVMGQLHRGGVTQIGLVSDPVAVNKDEKKKK